MAYVLVLVSLLGAFLWTTPARTEVTLALGDSARALGTAAHAAAGPLTDQGAHLVALVRQKALGFLRAQLHTAIDETVK